MLCGYTKMENVGGIGGIVVSIIAGVMIVTAIVLFIKTA